MRPCAMVVGLLYVVGCVLYARYIGGVLRNGGRGIDVVLCTRAHEAALLAPLPPPAPVDGEAARASATPVRECGSTRFARTRGEIAELRHAAAAAPRRWSPFREEWSVDATFGAWAAAHAASALRLLGACDFQCVDACGAPPPARLPPVCLLPPAAAGACPRVDDAGAGAAPPPAVAVMFDSCVTHYGTVYNGRQVLYSARMCEPEEPVHLTHADCGAWLDEVVVITQYFGKYFFHFLIENMARLALVAPYLRAHPGVAVVVHTRHMPFIDGLLGLLGIPHARLVGAVCARTVLVPEPVRCGSPSAAHLAALQRELRWGMGLPVDDGAAPGGGGLPLVRRSLLVVRRDGTRSILNFGDLVGALGARFNATYTLAVRARARWGRRRRHRHRRLGLSPAPRDPTARRYLRLRRRSRRAC